MCKNQDTGLMKFGTSRPVSDSPHRPLLQVGIPGGNPSIPVPINDLVRQWHKIGGLIGGKGKEVAAGA